MTVATCRGCKSKSYKYLSNEWLVGVIEVYHGAEIAIITIPLGLRSGHRSSCQPDCMYDYWVLPIYLDTIKKMKLSSVQVQLLVLFAHDL